MRQGPPRLAYAGLQELGERPHVMLDGAPRKGTALTLSHWPATPSPDELGRDTSTEIALAYLERPEWWADVELATCDHLDEDGAGALWCLVDPPAARRRAGLLAAAARAGDFETLESPEAGQVAWALRCLFHPERSPLAGEAPAPAGGGKGWQAFALAAALEQLPALLDAPGRFEAWWGEEEAAWRAGERALAHGAVRLDRVGRADLALVSAEEVPSCSPFAAIGHRGRLPVHPAVLHSRLAESRVLVRQGDRYCYYDRYESWVRYRSRAVPMRRDLQPLAERLTGEETGGTRWQADPPGAVVPVLQTADAAPSSLPLKRVLELLLGHLEQAPPAWAPFRAGGALVAPDEAGSLSEVELSGAAAPRAGTSGRGPARSRGRRRAAPSA